MGGSLSFLVVTHDKSRMDFIMSFRLLLEIENMIWKNYI